MTAFWVMTPAFRLNAQMAIAAARAGETGILDTSLARVPSEIAHSVEFLRQHAGKSENWGVRVELFGRNEHLPAVLAPFANVRCPLLVIATPRVQDPALPQWIEQAHQVADAVYLEVYRAADVLAAQAAGCDGVLIKGNEAGGLTSTESALSILGQSRERVQIPIVIQGAMGVESFVDCFRAGAASVALCEQIWLAQEAPWNETERQTWSTAAGCETSVVQDRQFSFRCGKAGEQGALQEWRQRLAANESLLNIIRSAAEAFCSAAGGDWPAWIPVGEGIQQAKSLAEEGVNVAGILRLLRQRLISLEKPAEPFPESMTAAIRRSRTLNSSSAEIRPEVPIAIVGLSAMFPGAKNLRTYWQNILNRFDAIQDVPADRWSVEDYFSPERGARDRIYSHWGGFLSPYKFDPMKWGIPPASVASIDPVQLLAMEVAWEAMVDAGFDVRQLSHEKTGVIFAVAGSHDVGTDYSFRTMLRYYLGKSNNVPQEMKEQLIADMESHLPEWTEDSFPGFLLNVIAGRIANRFNFGGTNYVVDAACAASLAAVHTAVEQLRTGSSDTILVGAVDITNNPFCYMSFAKTQALSPRGRARPFDNTADGIVLGEGIGAILLKRLSDAERDGDKIYAVIKGIGSSSDGRNRSMTAPYPPGQMKAVVRAYEDARFSPSTVSLIEAHATGTAVGDRAEVTSLSNVLSQETDSRQFAALGSVKSMIGHTKTAAGLASLIKTALALKHQVLPPTLGVDVPNQEMHFEESPFYVNSETRPWLRPAVDAPRRAGVSGFGFGGTNFHVALEEYQGSFHDGDQADLTPRSSEVLAWSGPDRQSLLAVLKPLASRLETGEVDNFAQLAFSILRDAQSSMSGPAACRLSLAADSLADLRKKLARAIQMLETVPADSQNSSDPSGIYFSTAPAVASSQVCFLYPGQGSQELNMLRDLLVSCRWAHDWFAQVNEQLAPAFPQTFSDYIYPRPAFDQETVARHQAELNDTHVAQPALGAVEVFATELLHRFGLRPGRVAGHSYGEYVALWAGGVLSREDLIRVSQIRGRIAAAASAENSGAMAAVAADAATTSQLLTELGIRATPANLNAPSQTVIAGSESAIEDAVQKFPTRNVRIRRLPVTAAFHSEAMRDASRELADVLKTIPFHRPQLPVSSNTLGSSHSEAPDEIRSLLVEHLVRPVLFEQQIQRMYAEGCRVFVEVGPGSVLSRLVNQILAGSPCETLTVDATGVAGWSQLARLLAKAWSLGLSIDLPAWYAGRGLQLLSLEAWQASQQAANQVKSTDWILTPARAVKANSWQPVSPATPAIAPQPPAAKAQATPQTPSASIRPASLPAQPIHVHGLAAGGQANLPGAAHLAKAPKQAAERSGHASPQPRPVRSHSGTQIPSVAPKKLSSLSVIKKPTHLKTKEPRMSIDTSASNSEPGDALNERSPAEAGHHPLGHLYSTFQQMLSLQGSQQQFLERLAYLEERLLFGTEPVAHYQPQSLPEYVQEAPLAISAPIPTTIPHAMPAAEPRAITETSAPRKPPIPVPSDLSMPLPRPLAAAAAEAPAVKPVESSREPIASARPVEKVAVAASVPAAQNHVAKPTAASSNGDGPRSTDEFRKDLLAAISDRTGYPIDTLAEDLLLEAGLGIDSIKTVEVFSRLKGYHDVLLAEDSDEDELLREFTQLKTIGDIVAFYQTRRDRVHSKAPAAAASQPTGNGSADRAGLQRYELEAVEATVRNGDAKKKRTRAIG